MKIKAYKSKISTLPAELSDRIYAIACVEGFIYIPASEIPKSSDCISIVITIKKCPLCGKSHELISSGYGAEAIYMNGYIEEMDNVDVTTRLERGM